MSGLLLPKHWRINWPMLMGHLALTSGHLTRTASEHLAKCASDPPESCCDLNPASISITLSGGANCGTHANGTFILLPGASCQYGYTEDIDTNSNMCTGYCYSETISGTLVFWRPRTLTLSAILSASGQEVTLGVTLTMWANNLAGSTCLSYFPSGGIPTVNFARNTCDNGSMTETSRVDRTAVQMPYSCTITL